MKAFSLRVIALASLPAFGACADTATTQNPQGFEITVAPLNLQGIGDACYNILIENGGAGALGVIGDSNDVVSLDAANGAICASQYGNGTGGDITYIAPCDASSDSDTTTAAPDIENHVTIWPFLKASVGGAVLTDWEDPCGAAGCRLQVDCNENEDTLVEFNLTIMREADQGFFDVAVNFSDIFCSAKVDCQYEGGEYIRLVHGTNGVRTASAVVAFACTDGNDAGSPGATNLYASAVTVSCDGSAPLAIPTNVAGNVDFNGLDTGLGDPAGPVESAVVFMGTEDLQVNGTNAGKVYWNTAVGFEETSTTGTPVIGANNCVLTFTGTASEGPLNLTSQGFLSYPFVQATVDITNGSGAFTCGQHPLDSDSFEITYGNAVPAAIDYRATGVEADAGTATTL